MVIGGLGPRWFGFLGSPYERDWDSKKGTFSEAVFSFSVTCFAAKLEQINVAYMDCQVEYLAKLEGFVFPTCRELV